MIVFYGKDRCLVNLKKYSRKVLYFNLADTNAIGITARGKGEIAMFCEESAVGKICVSGNMRKKYKADVTCDQNKSVLFFTVGKGIVDVLNFTLI